MKILILAYDFPPLISISGQRPYSWYKYLPDSDISVAIITRHWSKDYHVPVDYVLPTSQEVVCEKGERNNLIIRVPFAPNLRDRFLALFGFHRLAIVRKTLTVLYSFLQYMFLPFDNKRNIYKEASKYLKSNPVDLIIATGEPFILFKYGYLLSKKYQTPWISDYRDLWTYNQGNYKRGLIQRVQHWFYKKLEQHYLSDVLLVTTAAPSYARNFKKEYPGKEVEVIYNGYDEEYFFNQDDLSPPSDRFVISYTGIIYPHQNVEMFLDGLDMFIQEKSIKKGQLEVQFFGLELWSDAIQRIKNYKPHLQAFLLFLPKVPYAEMVTKLYESHLLLLLSRVGADWLNAKVFDYLASKRKIILVENDKGILEQILEETNGGFEAATPDEVRRILVQEYDAFQANASAYAPSNDHYKYYSRKNQAKLLAALLKNKRVF